MKGSRDRSDRLRSYASLAAVVASTAGAVGCADEQSTRTSESEVVDVPSTSVPAEVAAGPDPLAVVGEFVDAVNAGDEDAVFALVSDDAVISDSLAGEMEPAESTNWLVWRVAQGMVLDDVECAGDQPADESAGDEVTVSCTTEFLDALGTATNATPAEVDATFVVSSGEIVAVDLSYRPRVGEAPGVFVAWIETQHPDDPDAAAAAEVWGESVEVSRQRGMARAEFAPEWADFALGAVEEVFAAYENRDIDAFLERFAQSETPIIGHNRNDDSPWFEADAASGSGYSFGACAPDGIVNSVQIHCAGSAEDMFGRVSGHVVDIDWVFTVDEHGDIIATSESADYEPLMDFGLGFQEWISIEHPAVHDDVEWIRPWLVAAEDWDTIRPYVDEFLAQSDDYPVDSPEN